MGQTHCTRDQRCSETYFLQMVYASNQRLYNFQQKRNLLAQLKLVLHNFPQDKSVLRKDQDFSDYDQLADEILEDIDAKLILLEENDSYFLKQQQIVLKPIGMKADAPKDNTFQHYVSHSVSPQDTQWMLLGLGVHQIVSSIVFQKRHHADHRFGKNTRRFGGET